MRWFLAALLALAACKHTPPPDRQGPVVPDTVLSRIGSANFVMAAKLEHLDLTSALALLPKEDACVRDVLRATTSVVIASAAVDEMVGYVAVPRALMQSCAAELAKQIGLTLTPTADGFDIDVAGTVIRATWHDGTATVLERGQAVPSGAPRPEITALLAQAPVDAKGVIAQVDEPTHRVKSLAGWLETRDTSFVLTLRFEGTQPGNAHAATASVIDGFKEGMEQKGLTFDPKWFAVHDDGMFSTLVATVPLNALQPK